MLFTIEATSNHEYANKPESHTVDLPDYETAKEWAIAHLDCSRSWCIKCAPHEVVGAYCKAHNESLKHHPRDLYDHS